MCISAFKGPLGAVVDPADERTGRPLGSTRFVARLEKRLDRPLARRKPGPKPKADRADAKR